MQRNLVSRSDLKDSEAKSQQSKAQTTPIRFWLVGNRLPPECGQLLHDALGYVVMHRSQSSFTFLGVGAVQLNEVMMPRNPIYSNRIPKNRRPRRRCAFTRGLSRRYSSLLSPSSCLWNGVSPGGEESGGEAMLFAVQTAAKHPANCTESFHADRQQRPTAWRSPWSRSRR